MPSDSEDERFKEYENDPRIPCQYGIKCYQKNPVHHQKYKHPPSKESKRKKTLKTPFSKKRRIDDRRKKGESTKSPERKQQNLNPGTSQNDLINNSVSPKKNLGEEPVESKKPQEFGSEYLRVTEDTSSWSSLISFVKDCTINSENNALSDDDAKKIISALFLLDMPDDFYHFYKLCHSISNNDPFGSFKDVDLYPVGPFDVFRNRFLQSEIDDKAKILRHWRYFFDPPEFQTVLKCGGKIGLHFGYWRDIPSEMPVFVGKNKSEVDCLITPVAENIFGAVDDYIEGKIKLADPFKKLSMIRLHTKLKKYAKENNLTLEKTTSNMQARQRKVVAKTFHKAGIVVPYDKKTELGYRSLAVTDKELLKLLKDIEEADSQEARKIPMKQLEEVIRLATIAADECDFGTCLELGHDLFSSGIKHVQAKALQMLTIAYTHLQRPEFLQIIQAHLKDRKRGLDFAVL